MTPTWGLTPKGARKLYVSVALPRIMYGIDVWCTPIHGKNARGNRKGSVNFVKKLTTTQRAGALAITGGFRTTPTDTLDAHAALLPMDLRVQKSCYAAITRMATLPVQHPLHNIVKRSAKTQVKRHRSPLHALTGIFGVNPSEMEEIPLVRIHPKDKGSRIIKIDIPLDKEASKRADTNATEVIKVYSDGSSHNGNVGAAAVLKREGKPDRTIRYHLGLAKLHMVYEVELVGILMGLHLLKTEHKGKVKCALSVDNQAALKAFSSEMTKPGQHIAVKILQAVKQLKARKNNSRFKLTFRWSAGHVGIEGNEEADGEAKRAAEGESSDPRDLPPYLRKPLGHSISALRQAHNDKLKHKWAATWASSPRYRRFHFQDVLTPYSQKYLNCISDSGISREMASRIFQLRVGHTPLNFYLHKFKRVDSPRCPACGHPKETVEHFLVYCPKYAHKRWPICNRFRGRIPKLSKLLTSPKLLLPLANFIKATQRFEAMSDLNQYPR